MPVPSTLADLSATLASNSPDGSEAVFPQLDNYLRAGFGLTAQIRDKLNGTDTSAQTIGGNLTVGGTLTATGGMTSLTVTGATALNGTVAIGDASGDTLIINPSAVSWPASPTHSGNHTFSGRVQPTGQPGFMAYASAAFTIGTNAVYADAIFNTEEFDNGSCYNTATGVFTVPVTGKYLCMYGLTPFFASSSATGEQLNAVLVKNSTSLFNQSFRSAAKYLASGSSQLSPGVSVSVILSLTAGDTLKLAAHFTDTNSTTCTANGSYFSALLVA